MPKPSSSPPPSGVIATLTNFFSLLLVSIGAGLRKTPTTLVLVLIGLFIYFRSPEETNKSEPTQFEDPISQEEPQPPTDLPPDVSPAFWTCVYRTDTQLSASRWADVYFGMEASQQGRIVLISVSPQWSDLPPDQRTTVVELVVSTWQKNSQDLALFDAESGLEKVTLKRSTDKKIVAVWTPGDGVRFVDSEAGA